jgi:hypothetical protein
MFGVSGALCPTAGSAWEPTPWRVVQRAAWETLRKDHAGEFKAEIAA